MKRLNLIPVLMLSGALVAVSCTDLDENLKDTWTQSNFLQNGTEIDAALLAPYSTLYGHYGHNGFFTLQEVTTDEAMIPQRGGDWYDGGQPVGMHVHTYTPNFDAVNNLWNSAFGAVSACNRLLETPGVSDAADKVAELKVLRAYYYWILLDNFGNVPLSTKLGENQGQKTPAQIYAFVESELVANVPSLVKKNDASTYGRLTYYAGQAILAKLYLNAQVYKGSPEYDKTIAACDEIINSGLFNLEGQYFDVFKSTNARSVEHIWAVPYDHLYGKGFNLAQMTLHYGSQDTYSLQQQPWNGYCSLEEFYNSYDPADLRRKNNFVVGPQFKADGVTPVKDGSYEKTAQEGDPLSIPDPDGENLNFTPSVNELFPNALRQAGARIGKYEFAQGSTPDLDNDFPMYRYGDILLTKAEALFRKNGYNDATGLGLVNAVHKRTGLPDFASITESEFLAERGRELFAEAWRRNDLIRFDQYKKAWFGKGVDPDNHTYIFPIPIQQITATAGSATPLKQNPGY